MSFAGKNNNKTKNINEARSRKHRHTRTTIIIIIFIQPKHSAAYTVHCTHQRANPSTHPIHNTFSNNNYNTTTVNVAVNYLRSRNVILCWIIPFCFFFFRFIYFCRNRIVFTNATVDHLICFYLSLAHRHAHTCIHTLSPSPAQRTVRNPKSL